MQDTLDNALAEAIAIFTAKRPKAAEFHARAAKVMPGGNTRTVLFAKPFPIRIASAEGAKLYDVDGHSYIDFLGEYSAGIYGHSHPAIAKAVSDAMTHGINFGGQHVNEVRFAEAVTNRFNLDRVRFTNSGTEANMMALAAARNFTGRSVIMPMHGGYHGGTLYFANGASPVNAPFDCIMGHFNKVDETRALIRKNAKSLAAIIIEPMLGSGGCIPASIEFLAMLREECSAHGIILIFDEVMTSRLHPNGYQTAIGIKPDLTTLGKYIGGGMSFGAFGGRADIMDQFDPTRESFLPHAGTFNNNTLTMSAGLSGITQVFTPEACIALNQRGEDLKSHLNELFMHHQAQMQITGIGSLLNIHPVVGEVTDTSVTSRADLRLRRLLYFHLLEDGIYIAERGFMALSMALGSSEIEALVASVTRFITRTSHLRGLRAS